MQCPIAWTWESAPNQWTVTAIVRDKSPTFETVLRGLSGCVCLLSGIKNKDTFWIGSLTPICTVSWTNGRVGCKVPTDLVKISVKEAMHMGFYHITHLPQDKMAAISQHFQMHFPEQASSHYLNQWYPAHWHICGTMGRWVNSLAPGGFQFNFKYVIFKLTSVNGGWGISFEITLRWMPLDLTDDKSALVQVMAWCHQATSHFLSQCWPRSMSPNGVTRPQWVNEPIWH